MKWTYDEQHGDVRDENGDLVAYVYGTIVGGKVIFNTPKLVVIGKLIARASQMEAEIAELRQHIEKMEDERDYE